MLNNLSDFIGFLEILDLFHTTLHNTAKLRSVYVEQHRPNSRIILDKSQISPLFKSKQTKKFNGLRNAQWLSESFSQTLQTRNKRLGEPNYWIPIPEYDHIYYDCWLYLFGWIRCLLSYPTSGVSGFENWNIFLHCLWTSLISILALQFYSMF